jgi:hypothetical protein
MIVSYNASAIKKIYNPTSSLVCFKNKKDFLLPLKTPKPIATLAL